MLKVSLFFVCSPMERDLTRFGFEPNHCIKERT